MAYVWELLAAVGTVFVFAYCYCKKKYLVAYFWGIVYGLMWEFSTEALFNYQNIFAFYIWKDIPLAIIFGWGVSIAGFQIISDLIHEKYKIKSNTLKSLAADGFVAGVLGISMEYLGSHNLALYTYPATNIPLIAGIPVVWPIGWIVIGLANLSFVRRLENALGLSKP